MQSPNVGIQSPLDAFLHYERTRPQQLFLRQPISGVNHDYTYREAGEQIRKIAAALLDMKLSPESHIAILSKNCAQWVMADIAIWMAGHVSVPLYPTLSAHAIEPILTHSEAKVVFVGKLDTYEEQRQGIPSSIRKICFNAYGVKDGEQWDDQLKKYSPLEGDVVRSRNDLATIKYTSGTTGVPKGVMITFKAFDNVTPYALERFRIKPEGQRFFSYLPLSHIAERMLVEMGAIYLGAEIHFSESLEKFPQNLMDSQPTVFLAVPRIWAKFREKIESKMKNLDTLLRIPLLNTIVKKVIRRKLGLSKAQWILTGAAPISVELLEWFDKIGIEIHEVYGMTENLAYSHLNLFERKFGTVGKAWENVEARIAEDGEVLIRHPGLMSGYYKQEELTKTVFTADGFLKTGDKGEFDDEGFLTITGRVKDQFKTDKAKFVDPGPIELAILSNTDIEQVCVVGMGIPQPIALTILSESGKTKSRQEVEESIQKTILSLNPTLEPYERINATIVLKDDWTIENGLMTPTLKVKRNEIEKIHLPKYSEWYRMNRAVIWE